MADNYYSTRLDAFINSLAIGVAGGATAFMSAAAADGLLVGGLGFLVSAACFEFARPDSRAPARDEPDPLESARRHGNADDTGRIRSDFSACTFGGWSFCSGFTMGDAMLLYLFQDRDSDLFALSRDKTSANIPRVDAATRWLMCDTVESVTLVDRWDLTDFVEAIGEVRMKGFHVFRGQYLRLHSTDGKTGAIGRPEVASRQFVRFRRRRESTH